MQSVEGSIQFYCADPLLHPDRATISLHPHSPLLRPCAAKSCSHAPHLCAPCSELSPVYPSISCFENVRLPCTSLASLRPPVCHSPTPIPLLSCWLRQVGQHSHLA